MPWSPRCCAFKRVGDIANCKLSGTGKTFSLVPPQPRFGGQYLPYSRHLQEPAAQAKSGPPPKMAPEIPDPGLRQSVFSVQRFLLT
jgi:hypothetical protein